MFLDRDGTLLATDDFLGDPAGVVLVPGAGEALRRLGTIGYQRIVVSNQSGVARGLFTEEAYGRVEAAVLAAVRAADGEIEGSYACFHLPGAADPRYAKECDCRKPRPGLLVRAARERGVTLNRSVAVGDAVRDLEAGRAAGCGLCVLVRTGKGAASEPEAVARGLADGVVDSLTDLPGWLADRTRP